uniref:Uncharacterized protein n=1 Tax=Corynecladia elata TaxID=3101723 RepID=A0AA51REB1_9FLOR|nr:hypothetical protein RU988_pgp130 [Laurencia elata]WMP12664.1 hypothetical protein [Laurencia elata]
MNIRITPMTSNLRNIEIDKYNENDLDYNTESYMYNYNTEEVDISNNSSHICLNEAINYYTECNKRILNSDT